MSKERLEDAKSILNHLKGYGIHDKGNDVEVFEWLIEQAERVQELKRFSISKDELKEVLNSNENIGELYQFVEGEHSIRDVFAIIVKEMGYLAGALGEYSESYFDLEQQNKRYQEALESLVKQETLGKDIKTGKTAISYNGMIALKGLGIFDDGEYVVYGADEIIESVLEGEE